MADEELKKAFTELQQKTIETQQQVEIANARVEGLQRAVFRNTLTEKEISSLPEGTRAYESVGRIFVLRPTGELTEMLKGRVKSCEEKIQQITEKKTYMEKNLQESEAALREMVKQRQQKA